MFAHLDGNNFYASCEKAMSPALRNVPLVVLSNNDGCVIARSQEAKDLGIKMGEPYFKVRHLEEATGLLALSANFPLYGDMSERMMSLSAGLAPTQEVYSIDEAFFDVTGVRDVTRRAWAIRDRVLRGIGIACGIGIAPTKTLAKFANHIAKTAERKPGLYPAELMRVCNLSELAETELDELLERTVVTDLWGVGKKIGLKLADVGIVNARQLKQLSPTVARDRWSVVVERTVRELRGESCMPLEAIPPAKQMIASTRSFGQPVTNIEPLIEAVSSFINTAAVKLRKQAGLAGAIQVFAHTSPFREGPRFSRSIMVPLPRPTADTQVLVAAAIVGVRRIFEPGYDLAKAGVILVDIVDDSMQQQELALGDELKDRTKLLTAVDNLNSRYGRGTVQLAAAGVHGAKKAWGMKQERRTPFYTTRLEDVPVVHC